MFLSRMQIFYLTFFTATCPGIPVSQVLGSLFWYLVFIAVAFIESRGNSGWNSKCKRKLWQSGTPVLNELPLCQCWEAASTVKSVSPLQPIKSEFPVNMENLHVNDSSGQSYGYVLYETVIFGGGHLHSRDHVRDRAQVRSRAQPRLTSVRWKRKYNFSDLCNTWLECDWWDVALLCSVLQVFVNTMYVGELDYNAVELSLPEGQVTTADCSQQ